jgi:di/tricarboxylate transporter
MTTDGWITVFAVLAMLGAMAFNVAGPDLIMVGTITALLALGILAPDEAFSGLANPAILTIGALLVVAAGIRETGVLEWIARYALGRPKNVAGAQMRLMWPVAALSTFLNNTPVVAMFIPLVSDWARRNRISPSMLLMPLSYAAILGGTCSLIGTSTNLVVAGMAHKRHPELEIGMFDITVIGLPCLFAGILVVIVASKLFLKDRKPPKEGLTAAREYTVVMRVEKGSPVVGRTIEDAGLRHLQNLYLFEIERQGEILPAVPPTTVLLADDKLRFTGVLDDLVDLIKLGIVPSTDQREKITRHPERRLIEAVVAAHSPLVGKTIKESRFRTVYDAAIIAVHRQGARVSAKVGDIVLEPGDVLLLESHPNFIETERRNTTFALISEVEGSTQPRYEKAGLASLILLAMVVSNTLGLVDLLTASLLAAAAMILTRCVTGNEARRSLDTSLLIAVACAFGVSIALEKTGVADTIATNVIGSAIAFGPVAVLGAVYLVTALLTGIITNAAAAAIMFPIAARAAEQVHIELLPMALLLMMGASSAFSTPIGYQTNLMVYGPGGYRYMDFVLVGLPIQLVVGVASVAITAFVFL